MLYVMAVSQETMWPGVGHDRLLTGVRLGLLPPRWMPVISGCVWRISMLPSAYLSVSFLWAPSPLTMCPA